MGCVVLGVFATGVAVVVFDQVFKDGGVEVEFLRKDSLEAEFHQLVDDGAAEGIALGFIGNVFADAIKQHHLGAAIGFYGKHVVIGLSNIAQGVVKQLGKVRRVLLAEQVADK